MQEFKLQKYYCKQRKLCNFFNCNIEEKPLQKWGISFAILRRNDLQNTLFSANGIYDIIIYNLRKFIK